MREYLFHGKRKDNGKWVEGNLLIDRSASPDTEDIYAIVSYVNLSGDVSDLSEISIFEVIPETLGQFTGKTDKNGKKVFEGTILRGYEYPYRSDNEFNYYAEVVYFDDVPAFGIVTWKNPLSKVRGISDGNTEYMEEWEPDDWEIIGNIHDNPELIGGDTNA